MAEGGKMFDRYEVPEDVKVRSTGGRELFGVRLARISKEGSELHFLRTRDQVLARNSEIPVKSALAWEFIALIAPKILPDEVRSQVFGKWEGVQVAPVLEKKGKARTYKSVRGVTVYSEMVGYDTVNLMRALGMNGYLDQYSKSEVEHDFASRTVDSTTYWFIKDVFEGLPELDPEHKLLSDLEDYWDEHTRINSEMHDKEDYAKRNLLWKDNFFDSKFRSSLKMIGLGHGISDKINEVLDLLDQRQMSGLSWRGKPIKDVLTLMLHLQQTSTQHAILWWFGIQHGHLHLRNTVSRERLNGIPTFLETRIIDFDQAVVSQAKLDKCNELYKVIDVEKLRKLKNGNQFGVDMKVLLSMYLPVSEWRDDDFELIQSAGESPMLEDLVKLITRRLKGTNLSDGLFLKFARIVEGFDKSCLKKGLGYGFGHTLKIVESNLERAQKVPELRLFVDYIKVGLSAMNLEDLTEEQKLQLLSLINIRKIGFKRDVSVDEVELRWVFSLLKEKGLVRDYAKTLFENIMSAFDYSVLPSIFERAKAEGGYALVLVKSILRYVFTPIDETGYDLRRKALIRILENLDLGEFCIDNVEFKGLEVEDSIRLFVGLRNSFQGIKDKQIRSVRVRHIERKFIKERGYVLFLAAKIARAWSN